jgi:hypothetical protein
MIQISGPPGMLEPYQPHNRTATACLGGGRTAVGLCALTTQATTLALRQTTPDTKLFPVGKGVIQTLLTHFAASTHFFGFPSGCTALRKEQVGVNS